MIAILSNINIDPIKIYFKNEKLYLPSYNQVQQEFLNSTSVIYTEEVDKILVFLDYSAYFVGEKNANEVSEMIFHEFNYLMDYIEKYTQEQRNKILIINNIVIKNNLVMPYNKNEMFNVFRLEQELNQRLYNAAIQRNNIYILNWENIIENYGWDKILNNKYWYIGRIRYTTFALDLIYKEYNNIIKGIKGITKKVCIVDLDNTLWGGVIGDDGLEGIALSEEGVGKAYRDFQKCIKSLKEIGILLCIASKNNFEIVKECFDKHPMMILSIDDFIITKINWNNKSENIKEIAYELNLGLDSFVFIDDNPFERQLIKDYLPDVSVPDFPDEPYELVDWFYKVLIPEYFVKINLTDEDLTKHNQYKANLERAKLEKDVTNYNTFIEQLNIRYNVFINNRLQISRISQLTQKTNQFNLTTKRYTELDIEKLLQGKLNFIYTLEYIDKFGKEGIVSLAIVKPEDDKMFIDSFLMSCRVFGRFLEYNFMKEIALDLLKKGITEIYAKYIPTNKNVIVKDFYTNCGFTKIEDGLYYAKLDNIVKFIDKNYIKLQGEIINE